MRRLPWAWLVLLAACGPADPDAGAEVAAELRALRQVLLTQPAGKPARSASTTTVDVATALAPLREALEGLAGSQHDLQQRQLALTQELQRWSALLVETANSQRREEGEALLTRLQQLEASLRAQDARHREVEGLMQRALDHTADRLGEFLRRVGGETESGATTTAPPADAPQPTTTPPSTDAQNDASSSPDEDSQPPGEGRTAGWQRRGAAPWWWAGAASLATVVGVFCLRRWRHAAASPRSSEPRTSGPLTANDPAGVGDSGVQEIWAAAALLGEAVGRLRDSTGAPAPAATGDLDANASHAEQDIGDDLIVIDDELLMPPTPTAVPTEPPSPASPLRKASPAVATCRLPTSDPSASMPAVLQILQADPRVLRRPEPAVRCSQDCLEVSFRLVPELPPGERSHLEQRLRDACRAGA